MRAPAGFTLVELITVLVVLGILAFGTVRFITDSSQGFASTVSRAELATDAQATINGLVRSLRDALPNSVRVQDSCIEYIPAVAASTYLTLPVADAAMSFRAVPLDPAAPDGLRIAVYPASDLYSLGSPAPLSPGASFSAPDVNNEINVTLAAAHRFPAESPQRRFFVVQEPVSFCVSGGRLFRYEGYGFHAVQPTPATLPATLPSRSLMAEDVAGTTPFAVAAATLSRNAVVAVELVFRNDSDTLEVVHSVQLRNLP